MIVYHGSTMEVAKPDILHSRKTVDFGAGFYVTPIYEQARKWSEKFRHRGEPAVISRYQFDEAAYHEITACVFEGYSGEWLRFVVNCRTEKDTTEFEIVAGGVANDRVFNTVELFFDGLIDEKEALGRLQYEQTNMQICFRTQGAIDRYLTFEGSETL